MKQMKHNNNQGNRWKKIMALLLSAAMLAPAAPGAVYASENPNDGQILEYGVPEDAGSEEPGALADEGNGSNDGNEENKHEHNWSYQRVSENGQEIITASCNQVSGCSLSGNQVRLTMQVNPDAESPVTVLKDGEETLSQNNAWGIQYKIEYYKSNSENGTLEVVGTEDAPPTEPGAYKVHAIFGGEEGPYLEADYLVHGHRWKYEKTEAGMTATCSGNEDGSVCDVPGSSVSLTLKVESENKVQVLANGAQLLSENAFGISYEIQYLKGEELAGTGEKPPTELGEYKVRAIFGGNEANYLEADYRIEHKCDWQIKKENDKTIKAICTGAGECEKGAEVEFTLTVNAKNNTTTFNGEEQKGLANISVKNENDPKTQAALKALEEQGISRTLNYYKDNNGKPGDPTDTLKDAGTYHVQMAVGQEMVSDTIKITQARKTSNAKVKMASYAYGSGKAKAPALSGVKGKIKETEWNYYKGKMKQEVSEFSSTCLNTGTYTVSGRYTLEGEENYYYETKTTTFKVTQGTRSGITVKMANYGLKCKEAKRPSPSLNKKLDKNAEVTYYYNKTKTTKTKGRNNWDKKPIKKKPGVYYMYAVIRDKKSNYKPYTTLPKQITVYADHNWKDMPKNLSSNKITKAKIKCAVCGEKKTVKLPKKEASLVIGKSMWLNGKNGNGCEFTLGKSAKVNKAYFTLSKKGKITTKENPAYYSAMPKSVPVKVTAYGKTYAMKVNLKIPSLKENDVKINYSNVTVGGVAGKRFVFQYNIPYATKMTVRIKNEKGQTEAINSYFDKYFSNPRPAGTPFINLSDSLLASMGNQVIFEITAHYGNNKSDVLRKKL